MAEEFIQANALKGQVDFGIITVREDEFQAVLDRLPTQQTSVGRQRYAMSRLTTVSNDCYLIASVRCLEQGTNQAQEVARTLIEELDPQWILVVGIAGSVPDYEYTLGDVLLASRLHDYSVSAFIEGKDGELRQEFTDMGGPMHQDVQSLLAYLPAIPLGDWWAEENINAARPKVQLTKGSLYGDDDWRKKVRECLDRYFGRKSIRDHARAFTGSVVSSGVLLKDTQTAQAWLKSSRDIRGIEMELAGVYRAAWRDHKPVLAIRGLSDIVGFKRSPDWTNYACNSAAAFTEALLRSRPITPLEVKKDPIAEPEQTSDLGRSQPVGVFKIKPTNPAPIARNEKIYSNLLEVSYFPESLHVLETDCKNSGEVWAILRAEVENPPCDWVYKSKSIYAFHDFSDPVWRSFREKNEPSMEATSHWADSDDDDRVAEFIELLRNCLKLMITELGLKYINKQRIGGESKKFRFIYLEPTSEFSGVPLLSAKDLTDVDKLVNSLNAQDTPFLKYVLSMLPDETQQLIGKTPEEFGNGFRSELAAGLNEIIRNSFYDADAFEDVRIRWEAKNILKENIAEDGELRDLNRMLLEDGFRGSIQRRTLRPRSVTVKSLVKSARTEAFKPVFTKAGKFSYYRHHAFRPEFHRFERRWFLEITPTYHYTWDGYHVTHFYEDAVSKIKKIERSGAVFRQVLFWSRILQDSKTGLLERRGYPFLRFGDLLEYATDYGIREELWLNREVSDDGTATRGNRRFSKRQKYANQSNESSSLFCSL